MSCISSDDCFGGNCLNGTCACGINYYITPMLPNCAQGLDAFRYLGLYPFIMAYNVFFSIAFGVGFFLSAYVIIRSVVIKRGITLNLSMLASIMVTLAFFVRFIYIAGDPHGLYLTFVPVGGRLCYSLHYDFLFGSYSFILLMWVELCGMKISQKTSAFLSKIKVAIIVLNVLLYVFEIGMSIYQAINYSLDTRFAIFYTLYITLLIVTFAAGQIHFGRKFLSIMMSNQFYKSENKKELARKVTILTVGCSCFFIGGITSQIISLGIGFVLNSVQMFLAKETIVRIAECLIGYSILFCLNYRLSYNGTNTSNSKEPSAQEKRKELRESKSKIKLELEASLDAEKAIQSINSSEN